MPSPPVPNVSAATWPALRPSGAAQAMLVDKPADARVALLGLPDELGIVLNGGRPGAAEGPTALRRALARMGSAQPMPTLMGPRGDRAMPWPTMFDAGDVVPAHPRDFTTPELALRETHRRVTEAARALHTLGLFPIAIGGGHDLTFPFVKAAATHARTSLSGIYFDAHLDVRETIGSGMPFRRLIEEGHVRSLRVAGLNPLANSDEHYQWFTSHGGEPSLGDSLSHVFEQTTGPSFASFDLDVLSASIAPGVSAPNPQHPGLPDADAVVFCLGMRPELRCFDIMELSPPHDVGDRTARKAAHLLLWFLQGLSVRFAGGHVSRSDALRLRVPGVEPC